MPKFASLQASFSGGEFAPVVYGRVDSERYKTGLQTVLNYLPTLQGPLIRRPGTKYVNNVKDSANPPALIPFKFNETQAYMLEFGQNYIRFYANGAQVITASNSFKVQGFDNYYLLFNYTATRGLSPLGNPGEIVTASSVVPAGSPLELNSPYNIQDVQKIKFAQNADTLYLTHPSYAVCKIQRQSQTDWEIKQVAFEDGPYLPFNSYAVTGDSTKITMTASASLGAVASSAITVATGFSTNISNVTTAGSSGFIRITAPFVSLNYKTGDRVVIKGVAGTVEANSNNIPVIGTSAVTWQIIVVNSSNIDLIGSKFVNAYTGSGVIYPALFKVAPDGVSPADLGRQLALTMGGMRYYGYITGTADAAHANVQLSQATPVASTAIQVNSWQLGTFVQVNGSSAVTPTTVTFHQNRLAFAGTTNYPQEVDLSMSSDYEHFAASAPLDLSVSDNNALQFNLNSKDLNLIRWLSSSSQGLLAGTISSEWAITPSNQATALTPTNFNAQQTSYFGTADTDVAQAGNATLYIQRSQRKVREMNYFFQVGTFRSTDLTELSEHITIPTITKLVVQKETQPLVWALRNDGILLTMTYNRDDLTLKAGWARHQLGGQSDSAGTNPVVVSMGVIPSQDTLFDQLWLVVKRSTLSGSSFTSIEYMTRPFDDSILQEDAFQGDCGVTFDNSLQLQGLAALNGGFAALGTKVAHGYGAGDVVKITGVVGANTLSTDINGNTTTTSFVNEKTFVVASTSAFIFYLQDFAGNLVPYGSSSVYISGGRVGKLVSNISGLSWLQGETIGVLADGGIHPDTTIQSNSSGFLTLQYPATKVQLGYRYNSDAQTLRTEGGSADGTSIGALRRLHRFAFVLHNIGDLLAGADFNTLRPVEFSQGDVNQADTAVPLFSGVVMDGVESAYDTDDFFAWRQNSMLPGMIQSLSIFLEEFDV
jgi:hypothetical protein